MHDIHGHYYYYIQAIADFSASKVEKRRKSYGRLLPVRVAFAT